MLLKYLINMDRKTKIIATVGPSLASEQKIHSAINLGADVIRINFSHGTLEDHKQFINWARSSDKQVAIMQDIQGPKIRTGFVKENTILQKSEEINLTNKESESSNESIFINYKNLFKDVDLNDRIFVDDGQIILKIIDKQKNNLRALILIGGELRDNQGVAFPDSNLSVSAITKQDIEHLKFGTEHDIDFVAVSFVRNGEDIKSVRDIVPKDVKIIAKIELKTALENIDEILQVSDGVMVARGDLGVQLPIEQVPFVQKQILDAANKKGKISITATEMLQSMKSSYRPTRAEVTDITNAILEGSDAVMLSAETSVGKFPVEVVSQISKIISSVEFSDQINVPASPPTIRTNRYRTKFICYHAAKIANETGAAAITTLTNSGYTGFQVSSWRPHTNIIVFTSNKRILCRLSLLWGVKSIFYNRSVSTDKTIDEINYIVNQKGFAKKGDIVINLAAMPVKDQGMVNTLKLSEI